MNFTAAYQRIYQACLLSRHAHPQLRTREEVYDWASEFTQQGSLEANSWILWLSPDMQLIEVTDFKQPWPLPMQSVTTLKATICRGIALGALYAHVISCVPDENHGPSKIDAAASRLLQEALGTFDIKLLEHVLANPFGLISYNMLKLLSMPMNEWLFECQREIVEIDLASRYPRRWLAARVFEAPVSITQRFLTDTMNQEKIMPMDQPIPPSNRQVIKPKVRQPLFRNQVQRKRKGRGSYHRPASRQQLRQEVAEHNHLRTISHAFKELKSD